MSCLIVFVFAAAVLAICTPKPRNPSCGVYGRPANATTFYGPQAPISSADALACAQLCARHAVGAKSCQSFSFNNATKVCRFGLLDVASNIVPVSSSSDIFFNRTCFDCGPICAEPSADNLLDNGGFESKLLGPWLPRTGDAGTVTQRPGRGQAIKCSGDCLQVQQFNLCDDLYYSLSYAYYLGNFSVDGPLQTRAVIGNTSILSAPDPDTGADKWHQARAVFAGFLSPYPSSTALQGLEVNGEITFNPYDYGLLDQVVQFDNFRITRLPSPVTRPAPNALLNPGFESGNLSSWGLVDYPYEGLNWTVLSPGLAKSRYAAKASISYPTKRLVQNMTTKPNTPYILSFDWLRNMDPGYALFGLWLGAPGSQITAYYGDDYRGIAQGNAIQLYGQSGRFSIPFWARSRKTPLVMQFVGEVLNSGLTITIDNFVVEEVTNWDV